MERFCLVLFCLKIIAISNAFRTDYVYNKKTNAYYKLHIDKEYYFRAKNLCSLEGAMMMTANNEWEFNQLHGMVKRYPDIGDVWIGDDGHQHPEVHQNVIVFGDPESNKLFDSYEYDYVTTERDTEKCDVVNKLGEVNSACCHCPHAMYPFICKVEAKDVYHDEICNVYDTGYKYVKDVGSCYKIPKIAVTWNTAYAECQAVGSHLVVINSEAEHDAVKNIIQIAPHLQESFHNSYYIAGFRTRGATREFVTIFNQTLEEAGYAKWSTYEPNNFANNEYCGSLFVDDGNLNDVNCNKRYGFICEKEKTP